MENFIFCAVYSPLGFEKSFRVAILLDTLEQLLCNFTVFSMTLSVNHDIQR